jgi:hypothetical protein
MHLLVGLAALTTLSLGLLAVPSPTDNIQTNVRRQPQTTVDAIPDCPDLGNSCDPNEDVFLCCGKGYVSCDNGFFGDFTLCPSGGSCFAPLDGMVECE